MGRYRLLVRKSVSKDLDRIPKKDARRIVKAMGSLAAEPRPPQSKKLSGGDKYRLRCGMYRIVYEIEDELVTVCVVKVGHRRDVYR